MDDKYWLEKVEEAFQLGRESGTDYEMAEFLQCIYNDLAHERRIWKKHLKKIKIWKGKGLPPEWRTLKE